MQSAVLFSGSDDSFRVLSPSISKTSSPDFRTTAPIPSVELL